MGTLARATSSGSVIFLPLLWPTLKNLPLETLRLTLERSSMTSTRPPILCSPTCPGRPQEACEVQVCFQDSDEDPARPREGRGGEPDREEGHHSGPLRDPWQVHLEARLSLHSLWISNPMMLLKLKVLIVLPS